MSNKFKKYPKIKHFKDIFKKVRSQHDFKGYEADDITPIYEHISQYPTLNFQGTVKLHGTNAGIGFDSTGEIWCQSRNRVLSIQHDNNNFLHNIKCLSKEVLDILNKKNMIYYMEYCGKGIQTGVAISQLDRMCIMFNVYDREQETFLNDFSNDFILNKEIDILNESGIFLISQFDMFNIEIDFENPELSQNKLVEITKKVGDECPVAKHFGISGIGEGVVWKCITDGFISSDFWFKTKDERHSSSKIKKLAEIDPIKADSIQEFVKDTVTNNRLKQAVEYFKEMEIPFEKNKTGEFIKWIKNDIIEEDFDMLKISNLTLKDVASAISKKTSKFYLQYVENETYEN